MTFDAMIAVLNGGGGLAIAVIVTVVGGFREWYYFGPTVKRERERYEAQIVELQGDRDQWKASFLKAVNIAEDVVKVLPDRRGK